MDHILKLCSFFAIKSKRDDFPVEGIVTGMRTITFFTFLSSEIFYPFSGISSDYLLYSIISDSTSSALSSISAALLFTISKNFSFEMFFSTSRMK